MPLPQSADPKHQNSFKISMQIPGSMQPSRGMVNERLRLPVLGVNRAITTAPEVQISRLAEINQQLDGLGIPIFSRAINSMLDVISVINSQDYEAMIEEICDLWYQVVAQIKQLLEEGIAKNIIGNMVEIAIRDIQSALTDYHQKFAETRYYSNFQENLTIGFLESVTRLLHELLGSTRLSGGEKPYRINETIESIGLSVSIRQAKMKKQH
ncbi:hypothetical protein FRC02_010032 [Tulasnella sp. 418]|nr:hypothetical protein FRC02_010032 [Tulasnella sp. 418]